MDFEKYRNTLAYPSLAITKNAILAELDDVPMTKVQRLEAEQKAYDMAKARHKGVMDAYHIEDNRLRDLFYSDAHDELGIAYLPKPILDKLDSMAWDRGHSSGWHEVYSEMQGLADLAELAYKVGKQEGEN